jgi:hypothetical protein
VLSSLPLLLSLVVSFASSGIETDAIRALAVRSSLFGYFSSPSIFVSGTRSFAELHGRARYDLRSCGFWGLELSSLSPLQAFPFTGLFHSSLDLTFFVLDVFCVGWLEHASQDAIVKLVGIVVGCAVLALLLIYLQLRLVVLTSSLTFSVRNFSKARLIGQVVD